MATLTFQERAALGGKFEAQFKSGRGYLQIERSETGNIRSEMKTDDETSEFIKTDDLVILKSESPRIFAPVYLDEGAIVRIISDVEPDAAFVSGDLTPIELDPDPDPEPEASGDDNGEGGSDEPAAEPAAE